MHLIANGHCKGEEYITVPGGVQVKRAARVSVNAAPEPVPKGKAITVNGSLTREDWVKHTYTGYGSQYVKLQFRTAGSTACTTVKTVKEHHWCPQRHRYGVRGRHLALGIRRHVHHRHCRVRRQLRRRALTGARAGGPARAAGTGSTAAEGPAPSTAGTPPGRVHP
ncbi:hypothetical protein [Streptomyces sp. NPDC057696]|uniref:hypothetical protein n=1 Tax=Streptomyces sp. NPDC057696 TaxID=3346218 RepID=UPI0036A6AA37